MSILELQDGALVEARVDDDLWQGARVPLADLPQAERAWLTSVAARALAALGVSGSARFESDGATARVQGRAIAIEPALRDLEAFLDAVQGALLIDEHSVGMTKRSRGDSPA